VRPLEGTRVLDFSRVLSGPYCGRALADLGADVIKVEPPAGDLTRFAHPRRHSMSFYYAQQNAGKRNISLDLRRPEATELLLRLVATSDVLVENFRPGVMTRMGLGYEATAAANPRLVYASISGYGQGGPWSGRRAYAVVIHAEMGLTRGHLDHRAAATGAPAAAVNEPYSHADVYAGLHGVAGILAALLLRERTGRGQHVDVAMAASLLSVNERVQFELSGIDTGPEPPALSPGGSPLFATAGGHLVTVAGDPVASANFGLFCRLVGRPELADDPRFAEVEARAAHRYDLLAVIQDWVLGFDDLGALEAALAEVRLPMGVVRSVPEVAASAWAAERGAIAEVSDRGGGTIRVPDAPWRFSGADAGVAGAPAYRGEHNREVLGELGLDDAELDRLEAEGVLSSRVPERG
jgi:CoA:oxalate CoA-transferase